MTLTAYEIQVIRTALRSRAGALLMLAERSPATTAPTWADRAREYSALADRIAALLPAGLIPDGWTVDVTPNQTTT
ncbi:hypothetical protein [Actinomadura hibisca]|uniref:hypothetical protein n=1 Tax=Actinomadura hibisca TaxID=68565 RepID=UPI000AA3336F|nr:hypothetical protein [Actinomadura hibisca]